MFPAGVDGVRTRWVTLPSGLRLRVLEAGDRAHDPVLLLHGWGASAYMWRAWFAPLATAGRYVLAVDLPGHGLSDKPSDDRAYGTTALADAIREFIDVEGWPDVDVIAQSMAGTIALLMASSSASRVRRLVVVNPACFGRVHLQSWVRRVSPRFLDRVISLFVPRWIVARAHRLVYHDASRITPRDIDEYWAPSQFRSYSRAMLRLMRMFSWERQTPDVMAASLANLKHRALVVLGANDKLVRDAGPYVEALCAAGAPIDVHVVMEGGHAVNEERPEDVVPVALAFLSAA